MLKWKKNDKYCTPPDTVRKLELDLGIQFNGFDPCPIDRNDLGGFDGLECTWGDRGDWVFVNPPFSMTREFVHKAFREKARGLNVCMLIPARMENKTWQGLIIPQASQIRIIPAGYRFRDACGHDTLRKAPQTLAIVLISHTSYKPNLTTWDWRF